MPGEHNGPGKTVIFRGLIPGPCWVAESLILVRMPTRSSIPEPERLPETLETSTGPRLHTPLIGAEGLPNPSSTRFSSGPYGQQPCRLAQPQCRLNVDMVAVWSRGGGSGPCRGDAPAWLEGIWWCWPGWGGPALQMLDCSSETSSSMRTWCPPGFLELVL